MEQAYYLAVERTEDMALNGVLEVNRLVFNNPVPNPGDDFAALMAVTIMALFRETSIL